MKLISSILCLAATSVCLTGCLVGSGSTGSTTTTAANGGGGGGSTTSPLTVAEITGTHTAPCLPVTDNSYGTSMTGYSILRNIAINTNLTYNLNVLVFSGSTCQGGYEVFAYSQFGDYTLGALSGTATEILYANTSSEVTVYGGTSGGGTSGQGNFWVTTFNANCTGGNTFTSGASSAFDLSGDICATSALALPAFPTNGLQFYDLISLNSTTSPTTFTVHQSNSIFYMGQFASYPTTAAFNYTF